MPYPTVETFATVDYINDKIWVIGGLILKDETANKSK